MPKYPFADRSGISAFIASVIIVSILILIGIAIAYWLSGAAGSYTREEIKLVGVYAESAGGGWRITIQVKNTGSADVTIENILLNQEPCANYAGDPWWLTLQADGSPVVDLSKINIVLKAGEEKNLVITVKASAPFTSGVILKVGLRSTGGEYSKEITLK